jgi:hypothetical protein
MMHGLHNINFILEYFVAVNDKLSLHVDLWLSLLVTHSCIYGSWLISNLLHL